ncbi:hypothetical protein LTR85_003047 [Meristemomyces frigidus]|nr:hypothetical protein LTR85_003047 [Meristemomyces frigidus]
MASRTSLQPPRTIVFITGASQGIGQQIARTLSTPSVHPGYHVIVGALVESEGEAAVSRLLEEDSSRSLSVIPIDVTSDASISAAAGKVAADFGRLDVLINNAGILLDGLEQTVTNRPQFERTFQVNLFGAAAVTEAFLPLLAEAETASQGPPRIVFVTSRVASLAVKSDPTDRSAARHFPMYRCSKAALNMLMLHFASLNPGWKVNGHDPGLTNTPLAQGQAGAGSVQDAAVNAVRLATLGGGGETGTYSNAFGIIPW